jgi:hypothetical protein
MFRSLLPWAVTVVVGVVLVAVSVGEGMYTHRAEPRIVTFLLGSILVMGGMLKLIAVATDPEVRRRHRDDSG